MKNIFFNTEEEIVLLKNPKMSDQQIATILGCSDNTVNLYRTRIPGCNRMEVLETEKEQIINMYDNGIPVLKIAQEYNANPNTISKLLWKHTNYIPMSSTEHEMARREKRKENLETNYFPYKMHLDMEIAASAMLLGMTENEYRRWISETKEGEEYFLKVQGTENHEKNRENV